MNDNDATPSGTISRRQLWNEGELIAPELRLRPSR